MRAIVDYDGMPEVKAALQLTPLVFVRPGELRKAEWAEIDFNEALWAIPVHKMKIGQPHLAPLATQAITILKELKPWTDRGRYVLPGRTKRPMSENAINAAFRRMGYACDEVTAHGFRATARILLDEVLNFRRYGGDDVLKGTK